MATAGMKEEVRAFDLRRKRHLRTVSLSGMPYIRANVFLPVPGISYYAASNVVRVEEYEELINRGWRR